MIQIQILLLVVSIFSLWRLIANYGAAVILLEGYARANRNRLRRAEKALAEMRYALDAKDKQVELAYEKAFDAVAQVEGMKRSTHQVQFMPLEKVLEKNQSAQSVMEKIANPGNEDFDFDDALLDPEQLAEKYMPNARMRNGL